MTTELHTLSGAYALDALSPEEAEWFHTHLDACPSCQEEARELQAVAALMGASEAIAPPAHLKARVLAAADRQSQLPPKVQHLSPAHAARSWGPRLLSAAAAVVLVVAGAIGLGQIQQDDEDLRAAPVAEVFDAPDAQTTEVETANGGHLEIATSESRGQMAVDTDELPPLTPEQVYQLWTIKGDAASSAGLLTDVDSGAAMEMPEPGTEFAITIEPAGGSDEPSTRPIVSMQLGNV